MEAIPINFIRLLFVMHLGFVSEAMEERSSMYIKKSDNEDMKTSGSGYSYEIRSGEPYSFSTYNSDYSGKLNDDSPPLPPSTFARYSHHPIPLQNLPLEPRYLPKYEDVRDSYGRLLVPYARGFDNFVDDSSYDSYPANYIKEGGSEYDEAETSSNGEKGDSGYSNRDEYAKGTRGQHGEILQKGHHGIKGAKKQGSQEIAGHFGRRHQTAKAHRGGSFSNAKGHDKGSKTTGYHKVFHKDEFKKDHSFYDKADRRGHFNRYGDYDAKKSAKEGAFKKGGNHDSGFVAKKYGAKGISDKGTFVNEDQGYTGARGNDKFYKVYEDFAKKGGNNKRLEKGYSDGNKFGELAVE